MNCFIKIVCIKICHSFFKKNIIIILQVLVEKISELEYDVILSGTINKGWHVYSQFTNEDGSLPSAITFENSKDNYVLIGTAKESETIKAFNDVFKVDVKDSFSFFNTEKGLQEKVLAFFTDFKHEGRFVNVEVSENRGGGGRRNDRRGGGRRDGGKRRDDRRGGGRRDDDRKGASGNRSDRRRSDRNEGESKPRRSENSDFGSSRPRRSRR